MAIKNVEKFQNVIGAKDTLMISIIISKNIERLNRTLNFLNPESKKRGELNIHFSDSGSSEFIIQLFRNLIKNDTQLNSEAYNAL